MTRRILAPVIGIVSLLLLWEGLVRIGDVRPFVLRAPSRIVRHLWEFRGDFAAAAWVTLQHAVIGSAIGLGVALLLGALMAASSFVEQATGPVLTLLQVTPFVAYIASVVLWLGSGTAPALFVVALVLVWKLKGKFVMIGAMRDVAMHLAPEASRLSDSALAIMAAAQPAVPGGAGRGGHRHRS